MRHGPNGTCPGYLEGRVIDGSPGRYSCPWCAAENAKHPPPAPR